MCELSGQEQQSETKAHTYEATKCISKYKNKTAGAVVTLPINALGMVILSHILSLISRPESGAAIVLTIVLMSVFTDSPSPS